MSPRIVRAVFFLCIFAAGGAIAQQSDSAQARAEVALSNDTLQMRYLGSGSATGVEGSKIAGTFWNSIDGMRMVAEAALLAAVALGPWLVLLLVVVLPVVVVLRRLGRRPRASAGATA